MKDNKGQALVEFILILPFFLLIVITMFDLGNILLRKFSLENNLDVISKLYKVNDQVTLSSYINENDIRVTYDRENDYITINVYKDVDIISPILSPVMGNPYEIKVSGVYYE